MRPRTLLRPRTLVLFALAALIGAAVAVLPALAAAPSEAKLEVNENCVLSPTGRAGQPQGRVQTGTREVKVTIAAGGDSHVHRQREHRGEHRLDGHRADLLPACR